MVRVHHSMPFFEQPCDEHCERPRDLALLHKPTPASITLGLYQLQKRAGTSWVQDRLGWPMLAQHNVDGVLSTGVLGSQILKLLQRKHDRGRAPVRLQSDASGRKGLEQTHSLLHNPGAIRPWGGVLLRKQAPGKHK